MQITESKKTFCSHLDKFGVLISLICSHRSKLFYIMTLFFFNIKLCREKKNKTKENRRGKDVNLTKRTRFKHIFFFWWISQLRAHIYLKFLVVVVRSTDNKPWSKFNPIGIRMAYVNDFLVWVESETVILLKYKSKYAVTNIKWAPSVISMISFFFFLPF